MSKKKSRKAAPSTPQPREEATSAVSFGYEEMLSELEAIVAEAEIRQSEELS